ncbi:hypothetical protein DRO53_00655 [Candidatus Bathyarchaeota archaeon]|nr:MAG: hypothetical protein DRO53_00655 [Candidatus Bathyarchaeota archaeon]
MSVWKWVALLLIIALTTFVFVYVFMNVFMASESLAEKDRKTYSLQLQRAADYLKANFNEDLKLVCESPDTAEFARTYWLVADNLYASYALKPYYPEIAQEISMQLRNVWGYREDALHGILFNHKRVPSPACITVQVTVEDRWPAYIVKTEKATNKRLDIRDYADRLCYKALIEAFHGNHSQAEHYFRKAVKLWDGKGLADRVYQKEGYYETYKLAMLYYTAKALGKLDELKFREKLLSIIFKLQADNGGFYTRYTWSEQGPKPLPGATTNTETTSLVIIALTYTPQNAMCWQS